MSFNKAVNEASALLTSPSAPSLLTSTTNAFPGVGTAALNTTTQQRADTTNTTTNSVNTSSSMLQQQLNNAPPRLRPEPSCESATGDGYVSAISAASTASGDGRGRSVGGNNRHNKSGSSYQHPSNQMLSQQFSVPGSTSITKNPRPWSSELSGGGGGGSTPTAVAAPGTGNALRNGAKVAPEVNNFSLVTAPSTSGSHNFSPTSGAAATMVPPATKTTSRSNASSRTNSGNNRSTLDTTKKTNTANTARCLPWEKKLLQQQEEEAAIDYNAIVKKNSRKQMVQPQQRPASALRTNTFGRSNSKAGGSAASRGSNADNKRTLTPSSSPTSALTEIASNITKNKQLIAQQTSPPSVLRKLDSTDNTKLQQQQQNPTAISPASAAIASGNSGNFTGNTGNGTLVMPPAAAQPRGRTSRSSSRDTSTAPTAAQKDALAEALAEHRRNRSLSRKNHSNNNSHARSSRNHTPSRMSNARSQSGHLRFAAGGSSPRSHRLSRSRNRAPHGGAGGSGSTGDEDGQTTTAKNRSGKPDAHDKAFRSSLDRVVTALYHQLQAMQTQQKELISGTTQREERLLDLVKERSRRSSAIAGFLRDEVQHVSDVMGTAVSELAALESERDGLYEELKQSELNAYEARQALQDAERKGILNHTATGGLEISSISRGAGLSTVAKVTNLPVKETVTTMANSSSIGGDINTGRGVDSPLFASSAAASGMNDSFAAAAQQPTAAVSEYDAVMGVYPGRVSVAERLKRASKLAEELTAEIRKLDAKLTGRRHEHASVLNEVQSIENRLIGLPMGEEELLANAREARNEILQAIAGRAVLPFVQHVNTLNEGARERLKAERKSTTERLSDWNKKQSEMIQQLTFRVTGPDALRGGMQRALRDLTLENSELESFMATTVVQLDGLRQAQEAENTTLKEIQGNLERDIVATQTERQKMLF